MKKNWSDDAWEDYTSWLNEGNKKIVRKINRLIKEIDRHLYTGLGKPEPLKYDLTGMWSRRINAEYRLVYEIKDNEIRIYSARDHY